MKQNTMSVEQEIDLLWACYDEQLELGNREAAAQFADLAFKKLVTLPENQVNLQTLAIKH